MSGKFVILTSPRSGSTWLVDLLRSNEEIEMFSELFIPPRKKLKVKQTLNNHRIEPFYMFKETNSQIKQTFLVWEYCNQLKHSFGRKKLLGFKLMYDQAKTYPELLFKLTIDGYKFIHLIRENHLDVELSIINAWHKEGNQIVVTRKEIDFLKPVNLDVSSLVERLSERESRINRWKNYLLALPRPVLTITYQELCDNKNLTLSGVNKFLGLPQSSTCYESSVKKISRDSYKAKIANYSEVKNALLGTKFAHLLEE